MELIRSKLISAPHAFPTRDGGVSKGAFSSLNSSLAVGDDPNDVAENLTRLARAFGVDASALITARQVHGVTVLEATGQGALADADAVFTATRGLLVGVRTADCLPILVEDPRSGMVAAVHAGWRGVIGEIVVRAIERLEQRGAKRSDLHVALGPAIQACCFEVDGDLPARFSAAFGEGVLRPQPGKTRVHLDLSWAVARSLERAGVPSSHVDVLPQCTRCDQRFFSHRRDQGITGRQLSLIQCVRGTAM
ncbi:MAG: peptidoglycan editing factor PgeF [Archangium sp.]|nr:peptidoglycan editing factor PgeF [Archangium sp.]